MKKRALQVTLHARESSVVELTVEERIQLDRLTPSPRGCIAERHGSLLEPGVNTLALAQGHYFFKTLSGANLRVVRGGVTTGIGAHNKTNDPTLPPRANDAPPVPDAKGDDVAGEVPRFTVE
jgi:hypothetical protein